MIELEQLRDFALEIAPELSDRPFYVCDMEAAGLPTSGTGGFALKYLPENALGISDWAGPGAVLAIAYGDTASRANPEDVERVLKAVVVHELGHLLPNPQPATLAINAAISKESASEINAQMRHELETPAELAAHCVRAHGPLFVRRCVHLWARSLAAGHWVLGREVLGYRWLSSLESYAPPFWSDTARMRDARFHEIDLLPLPQHTLDLHAADVKCHDRYFARDTEQNAA